MNKHDLIGCGVQMALQARKVGQARFPVHLLFHVRKVSLYVFEPHKVVLSRTALQFRLVDERRPVIHFFHFLQLAHQLIEQFFQCLSAPSCPESRDCAVIRRSLVSQ